MRRTSFPAHVLGLLAAALAGCGGGGGDNRVVPALEFTRDPVFTTDEGATQVAHLSFSTNLNTIVDVSLDDGNGHAFTISFPDNQNDHDLTIMGLRPDRTYSLSVVAQTLDNFTIDVPVPAEIVMPPLPDDFPSIEILLLDPDAISARYTLLDARRKDRSAAYVIILDDAGEVVWYYKPGVQSETDRLDSGNYLILDAGSGLITELDDGGREIVSYHSAQSSPGTETSIAVDANAFHHDVVKIESEGRYLTSIRDDSRQVENFPIDEFDASITGTVNVRDEPILEFDEDGNIVARWDFLDMLKPTRIGYNGTRGLPNQADWVHINAVEYDARNDLILASARHQDAVVAFSRETGELRWILGPPENWEGFEEYLLTPTGEEFAWPYHMHAPEITPSGSILLFDNANNRASPFTGEPIVPADANWSRAVEYVVDSDELTIEQVWEWGLEEAGEALYAPFVGDADRLFRRNNTLITFGGLCFENGVPSQNLRICRSSGRVIEVDTSTNEKVLDIAIDDTDPTSTGYLVYRSERMFSLYTNTGIAIVSDSDGDDP